MKTKNILWLAILALTIFASCKKDDENPDPGTTEMEYFLVANRGSSTVTVYNASTMEMTQDITLPGAGADPTYIAFSDERGLFYVGDFANQEVLAFDAVDFSLKHTIAIQEGAFHMWASDAADQLWVNNIVSKTTSVIDLSNHTVVKTLGLPTDEIELSADAGQHDVILSTNGSYAYTTILDGADKSYVVQYSTTDFSYMRNVMIGGDAHLLIVGDKLFAAAQNGNEITVLNQNDLSEVDNISINGPHGVAANQDYFFTAALPEKSIGVIDLANYNVVNNVATAYDTPHNLAINADGTKLFLSHSGGTVSKVVFYEVSGSNLSKTAEYDSGTNPFGVLYYKY